MDSRTVSRKRTPAMESRTRRMRYRRPAGKMRCTADTRAAKARRPATGHAAEMRATADMRRSAKMRPTTATHGVRHSTAATHGMRGSAAATEMRCTSTSTAEMRSTPAATAEMRSTSASAAGSSRRRVRRPRKSDNHAGNG